MQPKLGRDSRRHCVKPWAEGMLVQITQLHLTPYTSQTVSITRLSTIEAQTKEVRPCLPLKSRLQIHGVMQPRHLGLVMIPQIGRHTGRSYQNMWDGMVDFLAKKATSGACITNFSQKSEKFACTFLLCLSFFSNTLPVTCHLRARALTPDQ